MRTYLRSRPSHRHYFHYHLLSLITAECGFGVVGVVQIQRSLSKIVSEVVMLIPEVEELARYPELSSGFLGRSLPLVPDPSKLSLAAPQLDLAAARLVCSRLCGIASM